MLRKSKAYNKLPKQARRKARRAALSPDARVQRLLEHGKRLTEGFNRVRYLSQAAQGNPAEFRKLYGTRRPIIDENSSS